MSMRSRVRVNLVTAKLDNSPYCPFYQQRNALKIGVALNPFSCMDY